MHSSFLTTLYFYQISIIIIIFFFTTTKSLSNTLLPSKSISLFGSAILNDSSIYLTKHAENCTSPQSVSSHGRAFYTNTVSFLDPLTNSTASFSVIFSFTIISPSPCPFGDGLAFLITSNINSFSLSEGYMGLPDDNTLDYSEVQDSYVAVEFDTSFNPTLEDINGNHIGIDVDKVSSLASVDAASIGGVDLKDGREKTAWIEYDDLEKMIRVWTGYSREIRPQNPVLALGFDLSKMFKKYMHVGFTASNGIGSSSTHAIHYWKFRTSFDELLRPKAPTETVVGRNCDPTCSPEESVIEFGTFKYHPSNSRRILVLALIFAGSFALILPIAYIIYAYLRHIKRRKLRRARSERQMRRFRSRKMAPQMLSLSEIRSATNGFDVDNIMGEGASAVVYKGIIPRCGNAVAAVKRFNHERSLDRSSSSSPSSRIPSMKEFAEMVGCLRHKNLLHLHGWCCEGNELNLVYEFMANGSLEKALHNHSSKTLTWERRLNILKGVASALIYLHEECDKQIIHRGVKSSNILLDGEFSPKLGDFGMSEIYATVPAGKMGYLAPEYAFAGAPSEKTDVYSFGIVALEITTGKRPVNEERFVITDYVWELRERGNHNVVGGADPMLKGRFDPLEMERAVIVGLWCAHPDCKKRPSMREALKMLNGEMGVAVLPSKKPTIRVQSSSVLPEGFEEAMAMNGMSHYGGEGNNNNTPWSTPRTHFSRR